MTEEDKLLLQRAKEQERGSLIDNLYRAGVLRSYTHVDYTTEQLKEMWRNWRP